MKIRLRFNLASFSFLRFHQNAAILGNAVAREQRLR